MKGKRIGLNGNQLKIIALLTMTLDHMYVMLFPDQLWLHILGRIAFPIFAFMVAEGCRHTRNKKKYLAIILTEGIILQLIFGLAMKSLYMNILITLSLSIIVIYALEGVERRTDAKSVTIFALVLAAVVFLALGLPRLLPQSGFYIDYGVGGVLLPVLVYAGRNKTEKLLWLAIGLVLIALSVGGAQYWSLLAVPLLCLYNGTRGRRNLKYLFYIYYPLHLAAIYAISLIR